jgi:hypothetical protein
MNKNFINNILKKSINKKLNYFSLVISLNNDLIYHRFGTL